MANCDDDYYRSRLTENLWEESGEKDIERRHAQIFRASCVKAWRSTSTRSTSSPATGSSSVSSSISACTRTRRLERVPVARDRGHRQPHVQRSWSRACSRPVSRSSTSSSSASTSAATTSTPRRSRRSCARTPTCPTGTTPAPRDGPSRSAAASASSTDLLEALPHQRMKRLIASVQSEAARGRRTPRRACIGWAPRGRRSTTTPTRSGARLRVERLPFQAEVFDPRVVRIPAGKKQRAAQAPATSRIHIMSGRCSVQVDDQPWSTPEPGTWCSCRAGRCTARPTPG